MDSTDKYIRKNLIISICLLILLFVSVPVLNYYIKDKDFKVGDMYVICKCPSCWCDNPFDLPLDTAYIIDVKDSSILYKIETDTLYSIKSSFIKDIYTKSDE